MGLITILLLIAIGFMIWNMKMNNEYITPASDKDAVYSLKSQLIACQREILSLQENINELEASISNEIISKNIISEKNAKDYSNNHKLPLPHINNLRKWIKNNKKAS